MSGNATAVLTRRVKQGVAEWYVRDLIEKSRRGMEESVRQGWHTGGPVPYGYQLEPHPHPNPHKAREGKRKHRLVPDPIRAPIVRMIFEDYCLHGLGLGALCNKLNRQRANRHRCQYVHRPGLAASRAAGHPRVLGIKEETVLDALFDFLSRRLFAPGRLDLLRDELARTAADGWHEHEAETTNRRRE